MDALITHDALENIALLFYNKPDHSFKIFLDIGTPMYITAFHDNGNELFWKKVIEKNGLRAMVSFGDYSLLDATVAQNNHYVVIFESSLYDFFVFDTICNIPTQGRNSSVIYNKKITKHYKNALKKPAEAYLNASYSKNKEVCKTQQML